MQAVENSPKEVCEVEEKKKDEGTLDELLIQIVLRDDEGGNKSDEGSDEDEETVTGHGHSATERVEETLRAALRKMRDLKLTEPQKKRLGEKGWTTPSVRVQPLLSEGDPLKPDHVFFRVMLEEVWCRERMESEEKNGRWWWSHGPSSEKHSYCPRKVSRDRAADSKISSARRSRHGGRRNSLTRHV